MVSIAKVAIVQCSITHTLLPYMWLDLQKMVLYANYKYLETQFWNIQFNISQEYWSYLHVFLHKSIAIQSNSLYLLYTGELPGFPTILDSFFTGVANTSSIPTGWEGRGVSG